LVLLLHHRMLLFKSIHFNFKSCLLCISVHTKYRSSLSSLVWFLRGLLNIFESQYIIFTLLLNLDAI
jgi:hypothetical protein